MMNHAVTGGKTATDASHREGIADDPEVSRLYTPLSVAKEEIWKRWHNEDLKKEVAKFLGNDIPEILLQEPKVALVRHIASPNKETLHFLQVSQKLGLKPLFGEYLSDKFVPENHDKYYLGKLSFYDSDNVHIEHRSVVTRKIIDIGAEDGNCIQDIDTLWGEGFVEFHHRIFRSSVSSEQSFYDFSSWFARHGGLAKNYYVNYLALFLCYGVLAEVFLNYSRKEKGFVDKVFSPAFAKLESLFGVKPIIIPLFHSENKYTMDEDGMSWMHYPREMEQYLGQTLESD